MESRHNTTPTVAAILVKFNTPFAGYPLPWQFKYGTRDVLADLFRDLGYKEGVEVGTCTGDFAAVLCTKNPTAHLTCIDPYEQYRELRQAQMDVRYETAKIRLADYNVTLRREKSLDAVRTFPDRSLDYVFIDGCHHFDWVCPDIIFWSQKVRSGGIVACHDCSPGRDNGVGHSVNAYTAFHHIDPWFITGDSTAFWERP